MNVEAITLPGRPSLPMRALIETARHVAGSKRRLRIAEIGFRKDLVSCVSAEEIGVAIDRHGSLLASDDVGNVAM